MAASSRKKENSTKPQHVRHSRRDLPELDSNEMVSLFHNHDDSEEFVSLVSSDSYARDPLWFQDKWMSLGSSNIEELKTRSFMLIDVDVIESALQKKGFEIIASGKPSDNELKVYFFGVVQKNTAVECLGELVVYLDKSLLSIESRCEKKYRSVLSSFSKTVADALSHIVDQSADHLPDMLY